MAEAPGHRLGQIIGDALELALAPVLQDFVNKHGLYLDAGGERPARSGKKVSWVDINGNKHDLDFVIERGGTPGKTGVPVAFIESAWRRYTKHSRNKAQEIQGAVQPLIQKYANVKPFGGAIIGGQWTKGAVDQLLSLGFGLVHIGYDEVVSAFATVGIDVRTDVSTPDADILVQIKRYEELSASELEKLGNALRACAPEQFKAFREKLEQVVVRKIERVILLALHGASSEYASTDAAISWIEHYQPPQDLPPFAKWEVSLRFTNGDRIDATFHEAETAVAFLRSFA